MLVSVLWHRRVSWRATILDEPIKIGGVRFIHKTFALGFEISEEMREDDQYGLMLDLASDLGRSSRFTAELYGHDVYNNGFTAAKYVGRDGKPLFALDHPVKGTGGLGCQSAGSGRGPLAGCARGCVGQLPGSGR
jgi:phage major head subunit gpT-like protein